MGLETATYIHQLVATNPVGATDPKSQGDDHIKLIKSTLQATFPNVAGAVTGSHTQINTVVGSGISGFAIATNPIRAADANAGVATTALRSDVQLVIDLADHYDWTGQHTFGDNVIFEDDVNFELNAYLDNNRFLRGYNAAGTLTGRLAGMSSADEINIGDLSFPLNLITSGVVNIAKDGSVGYVAVAEGTDTRPGYIQFYTVDNVRKGYIGYSDGADRLRLVVEDGWSWRFTGDIILDNYINTSARGNIRDGSLAVIDVPSTTSWERGKCRQVTGGVTLNTSDMAEGYTFAVYNNSASAITITQGSGVTLRLGGTTSTGNRSLAARGMASIWCRSGTEAIITGNVS